MISRPQSAADSHGANSENKADGAPNTNGDSQIDGYTRLQALLHQETVQGVLRRALDSISCSTVDLASLATIEPGRLKDFYWSDAELSGQEIDRLASALHLRLVRRKEDSAPAPHQ